MNPSPPPRLQFLRLLLALAWCLAWSAPAAAPTPADLVVRRANVFTSDTNQPHAQGFAVTNGRFVSVDSDEAIAAWVGSKTVVLELAGKTVVPGFIDAHLHPQPIYPEDSRWASVDCRPDKVRTIDDLVAALRRKADQTRPGLWVSGTRYQETKLGRQPTRWDLDRASTNHPVIITHSSGHQSVCNSLALQLARITRDTPDPPGGRFLRDNSGELTGLLQERAASMVRSAVPRNPDPPEAEVLAGYRECFRQFLSRGITGVHVAGVSESAAQELEKARSADTPLRLYVMLTETSMDEAIRHKGQQGPDDAVRYGAIKLFHGNSLSAQTCWLTKSYADRPDYFGVPPARSQEALNKLILKIHQAGLQACVHCNGDREIEMLLTAFEQALQQVPRASHRHRIEHCSVVNEDILRRIQRLGLVVAPHSYIWEHGDKMEAYGAWRWDWMHPARALLDRGIPMAGTSDYSVSAAEPLLRVQDLVTRTSAEGKVYGPSQRITVEEALRAWTLGSAYAGFAEDRQGSITTGKLADFVVLAADPARVDSSRIKDITVEATFIGGRKVWPAP